MKKQETFHGFRITKAIITIFICMATVFNASVINAQTQKITVKGIIKDATGEIILGANVSEKEKSTNGTITDSNGTFTLSVSSNSTLIVSYIGYATQQIPVNSQTTINVTLKENSKTLDEVVVVGFGTQKKVNLTGSVGVANAEALSSRPVTSAAQALQGLIPGLQISSNGGSLDKNANINIRGTGTIGEGSSGNPLILIDGIEGDINAINPQDIETISVLKDAAAASIYGSRAPFGVILVTTKSGKNGKNVVNYNNSFRWSRPTRKPKMMDSYTFALYFNDASTNAGWQPHFSKEHIQRILDYQNGKLSSSIPSRNDRWDDGYATGNDNIDWYDEIYENQAFSQEHNLSVSGGTEKINFYTSLNYLNQDGLLNNQLLSIGNNKEGLQRYTATAKLSAQLAKWATFSYNIRFIRTDLEAPSALDNTLYTDLARQGWPTLPLFDPNGYLYSSPSPALGLATGGSKKTQTDFLYNQASFILEPIKNWRTHLEFNYRIQSENSHSANLVTYNHDVNGFPYAYNKNSGVGENMKKENYMNINIYSEYSHIIKEKNHLKGMAGFQAEEMRQKLFDLYRNGVILPNQPEVNLTSGTDYDGQPISPNVNGERNQWSTAGFFGRLNYDYDNRYLAEVNLRYDGTSKFRSNRRWNLFPSISLGYNISHESFWEPLSKIIGTLKIRGSYGELGNQNIDNWYQTYQTLDISSNSGTWLQDGKKPTIAKTPNLISDLLTWEKIKTWNIGLDWGVFNNRLTGTFDYFVRKTSQMVGKAPEMPAVLGTNVPNTNNTDLKTTGWELELAWNDRLRNGFGYSIKGMLSDAQTEILSYPNNPTNSIDSYRAGALTGEIWGYETTGIAKTQEQMDNHINSLNNAPNSTGKGQSKIGDNWGAGDIMYSDLNGDGEISEGNRTTINHGDLKVIGNSTPRYQFAIDLSADWKGFDIRAFFQGVLKRDYWQDGAYFWGATDNKWWSVGLNEHTDYFRSDANHPLGANLDSYYPRPLFNSSKNQKCQSRYLQDGSYMRLKNLQLGYTLPNRLTSKASIQKARIFVSGENLFVITKTSKVFDPEVLGGGNDSKNGNAYPFSATLSFGLSVTF